MLIVSAVLALGAPSTQAAQPRLENSAPATESDTDAPSQPPLVAVQLDADNFDALRVGGPDADAGIGDWLLSNGSICAAISDPSHESPVAPHGGVLIDLGHCGRDDDQWAVLQPMLNLSPSDVIDYGPVEVGTTTAEAWIRTSATRDGVNLVTTYSVSLARPTLLEVVTRVERRDPGARLFALGATLLHPSSQTRPFSIQRSAPDRSFGFQFPHSDRHSMVAMFKSLHTADLQVLVGSDGYPPISYAIEQLGGTLNPHEGETETLRPFSATGKHFTMFNTLLYPFWIGTAEEAPSLIDLARVSYADLPKNAQAESAIRIWVGDRAEVASVTNQIWRREQRVLGQTNEPNATIHFERLNGAPVTVAAPQPTGGFEAYLPPGDYRVRAAARGGREAEVQFSLPAETPEFRPHPSVLLPPLKLDPASTIQIAPSRFRGRVVLIEQESGETVVFGDDGFDLRTGTEAIASAFEAPFLTYVGRTAATPPSVNAQDITPPFQNAVAPGHYRVLAVRGPEYEIHEQRIHVKPDTSTQIKLPALRRIRPTPGFVAADLHVHSGESFDSGLPQTAQIEAFVASGAEVLVATEHDRLIDPGPALRSTGLEDEVALVNGLEMTSSFAGGDSPHSTGHWNLFPMEPTPRAFRGGVPNLEGRRIRDAIADIRKLGTKPFLQLNHPRAGAEVGEGDLFFNHLGVAGVPFDPTHPLLDAPNKTLLERSEVTGVRDLDYDGVELLNGADMLRYRRVRADWFSLLLQGEYKVATANSDSHRLGVLVGLPRTYVALHSDRLDAFDEHEFVAALRRGAAYGSTGPLLNARLVDTEDPAIKATLGETISSSKSILEVQIDAADWVPVDEWRVFVNGELIHRADVVLGEEERLPLVFTKDSFVTIEVEGKAKGSYASVMPGFTPFAFSNPIFVDVDGNGRFDAPGLEAPLPPTISDPDRHD